MNTTSEFEVQFNQALPVLTRRDVLTVTGNALLNGNLVLENLNASVLPTAATTFTVLDAAIAYRLVCERRQRRAARDGRRLGIVCRQLRRGESV